jgi:hypothetical protein
MDQQLVWPKLLRTAEFACNNAVNATTGVSPFQALYGYSPDFRLRIEGDAPQEEVPATQARVEKLEELRQQIKEHWRTASEAQAKHYNKRHKPIAFKRGDLVALSTKNLRIKGSRKLSPRFIGPFRVLDMIGKQAYRLSLPNQYSRIHNVFHVSLLEPWHQRQERTNPEAMPMPDLEDDEEWEIEEVKDEQKFHGQPHLLVKWKGWPSEYNQWVAEDDMQNAQRAITSYRKQKRTRTSS